MSKTKVLLKYLRFKFKVLSVISKRKTAREAFKLFCTPLQSSPNVISVVPGAEPISIKYNGLNIFGNKWNTEGGKKVLILHGFSSSAPKFNHMIPMLIAKGYEVISFDAPAHGKSEGKTVNAVVYAGLIKYIYETFGPIDSFIGHSFGGLAVSLALEEIKPVKQCKIVLIAPATETSTAIDQAFKLLKLHNDGVRKEFEKIIFKMSGHTVDWFSVKRAINNINALILWIHDKQDDTTPISDVQELIDNPPSNVKFMITDKLGHRRIYRDQKVLEAIESFL